MAFTFSHESGNLKTTTVQSHFNMVIEAQFLLHWWGLWRGTLHVCVGSQVEPFIQDLTGEAGAQRKYPNNSEHKET